MHAMFLSNVYRESRRFGGEEFVRCPTMRGINN